MKGYFITGTDTDVGKTIATAVLGLLFQKKGMKVGVMKPVASGGREIEGKHYSEDAIYFKKVLSLTETLQTINPVCFEHPLAPKVAADQVGRELDLAAVQAAYTRIKGQKDVLLIEGVGGVMVPLRHDYLVLDMIKDFKFPVIIITRPNLGTINHTVLTTSILKQENIPIAGLIFNYMKKQQKGLAERTNPQEVQRIANVPVLGEIPFIEDVENIPIVEIEKHLDISPLL